MRFANLWGVFRRKNSANVVFDAIKAGRVVLQQGRRSLREHDFAVALHGAFELGEKLVLAAVLEAVQVADDHELAAAPRVRHVDAVRVVREPDPVPFAASHVRDDDRLAFAPLETVHRGDVFLQEPVPAVRGEPAPEDVRERLPQQDDLPPVRADDRYVLQLVAFQHRPEHLGRDPHLARIPDARPPALL